MRFTGFRGCVFVMERHSGGVNQVILALLGSFGLVVVLAGTFVLLCRRHQRLLRRRNRTIDPLTHIAFCRRRLLSHPLPSRWMLVRSSNHTLLHEALGLASEEIVSWSDALIRAREHRFFVSQPVDGWMLVVGAALPDPVVDVDRCFCFLTSLSREVAEVQYFQLDRILNYHAWARVRDGRVQRAYAWAGETLWNEGRVTLEERLLGLRCRAYGEETDPPRYGERLPEQVNAERVPLLARRWGIDLASLCEILLVLEAVESEEDPDTLS